MKIILLVFLFIAYSTGAQTQIEVDPFNTYRWDSNSKKPWYEWWYYKIVLPETQESFYFVYGIVNPWDFAGSMPGTRAYTGMGDFSARYQVENIVPLNQFSASKDQTLIRVGNQLATDKYIEGNLTDELGENTSWSISLNKEWAFNAMGWALGKNITNISWYPAQAAAKCSGQIISKGKLHQFTNAPCYQDRNWGSSFPLWWTWVVSNHFKNHPETTLAVGGGRPKYYDTKFPLQGVTIGLKHKNIVYDFRPNDLDAVSIDIKFGKWEMSANDGKDRIDVSAYAPKEKFMDLQFVTPTGEVFHDYETLFGEVTVKLYKRDKLKWKLIDTLYSDAAGIEFGEPGNNKSLYNFFQSEYHQ